TPVVPVIPAAPAMPVAPVIPTAPAMPQVPGPVPGPLPAPLPVSLPSLGTIGSGGGYPSAAPVIAPLMPMSIGPLSMADVKAFEQRLKGPSDEELASRSGDGGRITTGQMSSTSASSELFQGRPSTERESVIVDSFMNENMSVNVNDERESVNARATVALNGSVASRGALEEAQVEQFDGLMNGTVAERLIRATDVSKTGWAQVNSADVNNGAATVRPIRVAVVEKTARASESNEEVARSTERESMNKKFESVNAERESMIVNMNNDRESVITRMNVNDEHAARSVNITVDGINRSALGLRGEVKYVQTGVSQSADFNSDAGKRPVSTDRKQNAELPVQGVYLANVNRGQTKLEWIGTNTRQQVQETFLTLNQGSSKNATAVVRKYAGVSRSDRMPGMDNVQTRRAAGSKESETDGADHDVVRVNATRVEASSETATAQNVQSMRARGVAVDRVRSVSAMTISNTTMPNVSVYARSVSNTTSVSMQGAQSVAGRTAVGVTITGSVRTQVGGVHGVSKDTVPVSVSVSRDGQWAQGVESVTTGRNNRSANEQAGRVVQGSQRVSASVIADSIKNGNGQGEASVRVTADTQVPEARLLNKRDVATGEGVLAGSYTTTTSLNIVYNLGFVTQPSGASLNGRPVFVSTDNDSGKLSGSSPITRTGESLSGSVGQAKEVPPTSLAYVKSLLVKKPGQLMPVDERGKNTVFMFMGIIWSAGLRSVFSKYRRWIMLASLLAFLGLAGDQIRNKVEPKVTQPKSVAVAVQNQSSSAKLPAAVISNTSAPVKLPFMAISSVAVKAPVTKVEQIVTIGMASNTDTRLSGKTIAVPLSVIIHPDPVQTQAKMVRNNGVYEAQVFSGIYDVSSLAGSGLKVKTPEGDSNVLIKEVAAAAEARLKEQPTSRVFVLTPKAFLMSDAEMQAAVEKIIGSIAAERKVVPADVKLVIKVASAQDLSKAGIRQRIMAAAVDQKTIKEPAIAEKISELKNVLGNYSTNRHKARIALAQQERAQAKAADDFKRAVETAVLGIVQSAAEEHRTSTSEVVKSIKEQREKLAGDNTSFQLGMSMGLNYMPSNGINILKIGGGDVQLDIGVVINSRYAAMINMVNISADAANGFSSFAGKSTAATALGIIAYTDAAVQVWNEVGNEYTDIQEVGGILTMRDRHVWDPTWLALDTTRKVYANPAIVKDEQGQNVVGREKTMYPLSVTSAEILKDIPRKIFGYKYGKKIFGDGAKPAVWNIRKFNAVALPGTRELTFFTEGLSNKDMNQVYVVTRGYAGMNVAGIKDTEKDQWVFGLHYDIKSQTVGERYRSHMFRKDENGQGLLLAQWLQDRDFKTFNMEAGEFFVVPSESMVAQAKMYHDLQRGYTDSGVRLLAGLIHPVTGELIKDGIYDEFRGLPLASTQKGFRREGPSVDMAFGKNVNVNVYTGIDLGTDGNNNVLHPYVIYSGYAAHQSYWLNAATTPDETGHIVIFSKKPDAAVWTARIEPYTGAIEPLKAARQGLTYAKDKNGVDVPVRVQMSDPVSAGTPAEFNLPERMPVLPAGIAGIKPGEFGLIIPKQFDMGHVVPMVVQNKRPVAIVYTKEPSRFLYETKDVVAGIVAKDSDGKIALKVMHEFKGENAPGKVEEQPFLQLVDEKNVPVNARVVVAGVGVNNDEGAGVLQYGRKFFEISQSAAGKTAIVWVNGQPVLRDGALLLEQFAAQVPAGKSAGLEKLLQGTELSPAKMPAIYEAVSGKAAPADMVRQADIWNLKAQEQMKARQDYQLKKRFLEQAMTKLSQMEQSVGRAEFAAQANALADIFKQMVEEDVKTDSGIYVETLLREVVLGLSTSEDPNERKTIDEIKSEILSSDSPNTVISKYLEKLVHHYKYFKEADIDQLQKTLKSATEALAKLDAMNGTGTVTLDQLYFTILADDLTTVKQNAASLIMDIDKPLDPNNSNVETLAQVQENLTKAQKNVGNYGTAPMSYAEVKAALIFLNTDDGLSATLKTTKGAIARLQENGAKLRKDLVAAKDNAPWVSYLNDAIKLNDDWIALRNKQQSFLNNMFNYGTGDSAVLATAQANIAKAVTDINAKLNAPRTVSMDALYYTIKDNGATTQSASMILAQIPAQITKIENDILNVRGEWMTPWEVNQARLYLMFDDGQSAMFGTTRGHLGRMVDGRDRFTPALILAKGDVVWEGFVNKALTQLNAWIQYDMDVREFINNMNSYTPGPQLAALKVKLMQREIALLQGDQQIMRTALTAKIPDYSNLPLISLNVPEAWANVPAAERQAQGIYTIAEARTGVADKIATIEQKWLPDMQKWLASDLLSAQARARVVAQVNNLQEQLTYLKTTATNEINADEAYQTQNRLGESVRALLQRKLTARQAESTLMAETVRVSQPAEVRGENIQKAKIDISTTTLDLLKRNKVLLQRSQEIKVPNYTDLPLIPLTLPDPNDPKTPAEWKLSYEERKKLGLFTIPELLKERDAHIKAVND
ncbi:MAG: hypothetical protein HQL17_08500, partial [Candidatus Omnitrophica bacterium]|nr:hypothetical protein [Candidatus Omnitrophota bacterium]